MSILSDYKIQLVNKTNFGKQIFTINDYFTGCLNDFYYLEKANDLVNLVIEVINTSGLEIEFPTQSLYLIIIKNTNVNIYREIEAWEEDNNITPDFVLPTAHFKVIVEAWKNYLQG
jgi:predicted nuclease of restriction endonuclease-like RecB superfamily